MFELHLGEILEFDIAIRVVLVLHLLLLEELLPGEDHDTVIVEHQIVGID